MMRLLILLLIGFLIGSAIRCARADDVVYPWYNKSVEPPESTIDEIEKPDVDLEPVCIPANDDCDDPEPTVKEDLE